MKYLPYISANLWHKPVRTLFTFVSIVFGFTLLGLTFGLHASLRSMAKSARADRIYTSARLNSRLRLPQMELISRLHGVERVAPLDAIGGYYQRPGNNVTVLMPGEGMREVFPELSLSEHQWEMLAGARDGAFVSHLMATRYGLKPGTRFPLIAPGTPRADGADVWTFDVLGIVPDIALMPVGFAVGNYEYLDQSRPQSDRGEVGQFWVVAKDAGLTEEVTKAIDDMFANSPVATRSVSEKALLESQGGSGSDSILGITAMALFGVLMIAFLTSNAIGHSIRERTRELAVLKTLGFSNSVVVSLTLAEAAIPCLSGCIVGLALAAATAAIMPEISPPGFLLPDPEIGLTVVSLAVGVALAIAVVASAFPSLRITRLDVATALARH
jgi:putative ABC transport system permease protein